MPTWGEIKEYVRSKYKLAKDEEDWFSLVWAYESKRTQLIVVTKFEAFGKQWVSFRSRICKKAEMAAEVALKRNNNFAVGAIALDGEFYTFQYTAPLDTMDIDEFELPLHVVASTADELESTFSAGDEH